MSTVFNEPESDSISREAGKIHHRLSKITTELIFKRGFHHKELVGAGRATLQVIFSLPHNSYQCLYFFYPRHLLCWNVVR